MLKQATFWRTPDSLQAEARKVQESDPQGTGGDLGWPLAQWPSWQNHGNPSLNDNIYRVTMNGSRFLGSMQHKPRVALAHFCRDKQGCLRQQQTQRTGPKTW